MKFITNDKLGQQFQKAVKTEFSNAEINVDYYEELDQQVLNNYENAAWKTGKTNDLFIDLKKEY